VFPDCRIELEEMHADDEFVYASWVFSGTPAIPGLGPNASPVSFRGTGRHRHRGGKVVEVWVDTDWLSVAKQVGRTYSQSVHAAIS
jgi:predicted ester cyclase